MIKMTLQPHQQLTRRIQLVYIIIIKNKIYIKILLRLNKKFKKLKKKMINF